MALDQGCTPRPNPGKIATPAPKIFKTALDPSTIVWPPNVIRSIMLANYYLVVFDGEHNLNTDPTELTDIGRI